MLLINVHQLDVIFAQSIGFCVLKDEVDNIRGVLSLESEDVFILSCTKNFRERVQVDAESDISVASEEGEHLGLEHHGYQGNMGVVHGL
jgi:hypothetical protein